MVNGFFSLVLFGIFPSAASSGPVGGKPFCHRAFQENLSLQVPGAGAEMHKALMHLIQSCFAPQVTTSKQTQYGWYNTSKQVNINMCAGENRTTFVVQ